MLSNTVTSGRFYDFIKAGRSIDSALLDNYRASLAQHKAEWASATCPITEAERVAIALAAMGEDVTSFDGVNLVELVCNRADMTRANEKIFALMMLNTSGAQAPAGAVWTREGLVSAVCELLGGDEAVAGTRLGDVDLTAMAIQAVAPYVGDTAVDAAVENGLSYLKGKMNADTCDFGSAEANAQVILALLALDRDPANSVNGFANAVTNVVCALDLYRVNGAAGYAHSKGGAANAMATEQALRALTAYRVASGEAIAWKTSVTAGKAPVATDPEKPSITPGGATGNGNGSGSGNAADNAFAGNAGGAANAVAPIAAAAGLADAAAGDGNAAASTASSTNASSASGSSGTKAASSNATNADQGSNEAAGQTEADGNNGFALAGLGLGIAGVVVAGVWYARVKRREA